MKNKILVLKNLKKCFHFDEGMTIALNGIDLDIYKNEFVSIVGPSGCGKSTILSILAGLINKTDGDIIIDDTRFLLRMNDGNQVYINLINIDRLDTYPLIYTLFTEKGILELDSDNSRVVFKSYKSILENQNKKESDNSES